MSSFPLTIVTPDGLLFEGQADKLIVRTITGDMAIMARHTNCVVPLGMGRAVVEADGQRRYAACMGGILSVMDGSASLVPTTFEWAESIDAARAQASQERAEKVLSNKTSSDTEIRLAQARLRRALVRKSVAANK